MPQGEFQSIHFALPSLLFGSLPPGDQVGLEFVQPEDHSRFHVQHGATDAGVLVGAGCAVRPAAGAEFDFTFIEVFFEFFPFGVGYLRTLILWP